MAKVVLINFSASMMNMASKVLNQCKNEIILMLYFVMDEVASVPPLLQVCFHPREP